MLFRRLRKVGAAYHQARRLQRIAVVLLKYGYEELAQHLPLPGAGRFPFRRSRDRQQQMQNLSKPERLRHACEELGPTFVKLGQLAAARTRLLPPEFTDELSKLQDQVAPLPFPEIRRLVEAELGKPLEELYVAFEQAPLGSASIAQVHRARLADGSQVVVKVQRPGIEKIIDEDLGILRHLAALAEAQLPETRLHQPVALVEELARSLAKELDFQQEAAHMERFAWQFRNEARVRVPGVHNTLTTRRVLTMEAIEGIKASHIDTLKARGSDVEALAARLADLVMKQIFVHGFFHADPHPGNLLVLPDDSLCFLDFGMMGFLDLRCRENFVDLVWGIARRDEAMTSAALLKLTEAEEDPPRGAFETDVAEFMHQHFYRAAGEVRFSALVKGLVQLTHRHRLRIPPDLVVMLKALSVTEELVARLSPGHDLVAQAKPFMRRTRMARLRPRRVLGNMLEVVQEIAETARDLPTECRRIVTQLRKGKGRLTFHHEGLEPAAEAMERSANRLSFALVVAALIIGSSLTLHSKVPPLWGDVSILGVSGYLMAGLMGLWLLVAILRHGRM